MNNINTPIEIEKDRSKIYWINSGDFIMEMKNAIAREGREAKNLILYHLSSEDESNLKKNISWKFNVITFIFIFYRNKCKKATNTHSTDDFESQNEFVREQFTRQIKSSCT